MFLYMCICLYIYFKIECLRIKYFLLQDAIRFAFRCITPQHRSQGRRAQEHSQVDIGDSNRQLHTLAAVSCMHQDCFSIVFCKK